MRLAFSVYVDVDERALADARAAVRDELVEDIRTHLATALDELPVATRDARVWSRATPNRQQRLTVDAIVAMSTGHYRVTVRTEDGRTTSRMFETRREAERWADKIDPLPLPDSS